MVIIQIQIECIHRYQVSIYHKNTKLIGRLFPTNGIIHDGHFIDTVIKLTTLQEFVKKDLIKHFITNDKNLLLHGLNTIHKIIY
jgi:hypothetical protein